VKYLNLAQPGYLVMVRNTTIVVAADIALSPVPAHQYPVLRADFILNVHPQHLAKETPRYKNGGAGCF
jgi:hypothetical protein